MSNVFNRVGGVKPRRNVFDLSYRKNFTCDFGELIPVMCDEVVPGDHFRISAEDVTRFQPMVAPVMHELSASIHYFFVPYRIIWDSWEKFISQGYGLDDPSNLPIPLPVQTAQPDLPAFDTKARLYTLWDYFGFPIRDSLGSNYQALYPIDFPWRAYNKVYNEYYRDENLQEEVDEIQNFVLRRNWKKDYFTASLPFRQKGQAPALPVNIQFGVGASLPSTSNNYYINSPLRYTSTTGLSVAGSTLTNGVVSGNTVGSGGSAVVIGANGFNSGATPNVNVPAGTSLSSVTMTNLLKRAILDMDPISGTPGPGSITAQSSTFNVSDLRLAFQTQKWLERNARGGTRYTEFLRSHFGVSPNDSRLDRPEYIGGIKTPIIISEVLQTSQTTEQTPSPTALTPSPQANMAGHGLAASGDYVGSYNVQEFGLIIGLYSCMPKPAYQDGINRQWLRRLPTDFYFPEFSHLSEQAIYQGELFAGFGQYDDSAPFGFTGQYDEMRVKYDQVCADMRRLSSFNAANPSMLLGYWNMSRKFSFPPSLNSDFITMESFPDIFAVTGIKPLIVNVQNNIRATRPMPLIADPGLVDHF